MRSKKNLPKIAVVGRPNVGKSTLINRICGHRDAIVHQEPMITRDRKYYKTDWGGQHFYILDTGGVDLKSDLRLAPQIYKQTASAIEESDIVVFVVDLKSPVSPLDEEIADILRKSQRKIIFTGNKWDDIRGDYYTEDYLQLGFGYPITVSAMHGLNINELLDEILKNIDQIFDYSSIADLGIEEESDEIPSVSILGRPNVGKSTLFNTIIDEERVIVDEVEGTTRDSIDSMVSLNGKTYRFIDTAGIKKRKRREEDLEFYSKLRTLKTIEKSDICLVLIDAIKEISNQDQKIIEICLKKGVSICVLFNKIDLVNKDEIRDLVESLDLKLAYADFIPFLKVSALKKTGIESIFEMIDHLIEERLKQIPDNKLIALFKELENSDSIYSGGKKFKIKFLKQIRVSPPGFFVFSNMDIRKKTNIKRYIEKNIREKFGFTGTPLFFRYKC